MNSCSGINENLKRKHCEDQQSLAMLNPAKRIKIDFDEPRSYIAASRKQKMCIHTTTKKIRKPMSAISQASEFSWSRTNVGSTINFEVVQKCEQLRMLHKSAVSLAEKYRKCYDTRLLCWYNVQRRTFNEKKTDCIKKYGPLGIEINGFVGAVHLSWKISRPRKCKRRVK